MKITEDNSANSPPNKASPGEEALKKGWKKSQREFVGKGAEVYAKA